MKKNILSWIIAMGFPFVTLAQLPDLPQPGATSYHPGLMPAGSYVIAMDNTLQGNGTIMNVKAYGLVVTLLNNSVPVKWIIQPGKLKDGIDFSVNATRILPTAGTAANCQFKSGPFVIFAPDTTGIAAMVRAYNSIQTPDVNIYRTNAEVTVDVRYDLTGFRPKAALLDDGGNWTIHEDMMIAGGVPAANYGVEATGSNLLINCYTFASEPHNIASPTAVIADIRHFVENGGNFLAQCHAVQTYENNAVAGFFQTSTGIQHGAGGDKNATIDIADVMFPNPDLSYSQFEGEFDMSNGGAMQNWKLLSGSTYINNTHFQVAGSVLTDVSSASVSKLQPVGKRGGMVFYLGNHEYKYENTQHHINGIRMYLNAFLTPSNLLGSIDFTSVVTCPNTLTDPAVLHVGSLSGPTGAYPLTFEWYADKAAPYGQMNSGDVLLGSYVVDAAGGSGQITVYNEYRRNTPYVVHIIPAAGCLEARDFIPNSCASTLPVSLLNFTAVRNRNYAELAWTTVTELNCRGFEVQRSTDGVNWTVAGFVPSLALNGNSQGQLTYSFREINLSNGVSQYRLKQTDFDDNVKYSPLRPVPGISQDRKLILFPNPVSGGTLNVIAGKGDESFDMILVDMNGRKVREWKNVNGNRVALGILSAGVYSVRVTVRETGEQLTEKLVINK